MRVTNTKSIAIVGSGLGGCFLALLLAKRGYKVDIYEKFSKKAITDANAKRSFSLTLYGYAVEILKKNGYWKAVKPHLLPMDGSMTQVTKNSKPIFTPIDQDVMPYYAVTRTALLSVLLEAVEKNANVKMHYQTEILTIDRYKKTLLIHNGKTHKFSTVAPEVIIGADGVHSTVRPFIQQGQEGTHSQEYTPWTYKQFIISATWVKKLQLKQQVAYTWTRKTACIASFPLLDGSLSALLIMPKGTSGFASLTTKSKIVKLIATEFPVLLPLVNEIASEILENPEGTFVTIHTEPWYYKDFMAIMGDAAHGFNPFFGQGVSAAFGDSMQLVQLIDNYGLDWGKIFPLYQEARKENMDALGEISKMEFKRYLRHKRADYTVVYDKLESLLHKIAPKLVGAPLPERVIMDPEHTATHWNAFQKQRSRAKFLGIPLVVVVFIGVLSFAESSLFSLLHLMHQGDN